MAWTQRDILRTVLAFAELIPRSEEIANIALENLALLTKLSAVGRGILAEHSRVESGIDPACELLRGGKLAGVERGDDRGSLVHVES